MKILALGSFLCLMFFNPNSIVVLRCQYQVSSWCRCFTLLHFIDVAFFTTEGKTLLQQKGYDSLYCHTRSIVVFQNQVCSISKAHVHFYRNEENVRFKLSISVISEILLLSLSLISEGSLYFCLETLWLWHCKS